MTAISNCHSSKWAFSRQIKQDDMHSFCLEWHLGSRWDLPAPCVYDVRQQFMEHATRDVSGCLSVCYVFWRPRPSAKYHVIASGRGDYEPQTSSYSPLTRSSSALMTRRWMQRDDIHVFLRNVKQSKSFQQLIALELLSNKGRYSINVVVSLHLQWNTERGTIA